MMRCTGLPTPPYRLACPPSPDPTVSPPERLSLLLGLRPRASPPRQATPEITSAPTQPPHAASREEMGPERRHVTPHSTPRAKGARLLQRSRSTCQEPLAWPASFATRRNGTNRRQPLVALGCRRHSPSLRRRSTTVPQIASTLSTPPQSPAENVCTSEESSGACCGNPPLSDSTKRISRCERMETQPRHRSELDR